MKNKHPIKQPTKQIIKPGTLFNTQTNVANILNLSNGHLSMILSGKRNITKSLAREISERIGKDPLYWMDSTVKQRKDILTIFDFDL